jgi:riboflavin kinase/FMN adenylyltransferase
MMQLTEEMVEAPLARIDLAETRLGATRPRVVVQGEVVHGDQRGRTIGFPTANLLLPEATPQLADGVYAGIAELSGGNLVATAVSVGRRSTFYRSGGDRLLEAHLLDFSGDLYGQNVRIVLTEHIRDQIRFARVEDLIAQLGRDVEAVRDLLGCSEQVRFHVPTGGRWS